MSHEDLAAEALALCAQLQAAGATVRTGPPCPDAEVAEAEATLGFPLHEEHRAFLQTIGRIEVSCERTWFAYGLPEALEQTATYRDEYDGFREHANYLPSQFITVFDEGDFANRAEGTVYDHGLGGFLYTNGGRWVDAADAFLGGYWGMLFDFLHDILERLEDADDILVTGSERHREQLRAEQAGLDGADALGVAVEGLYRAFASYPRLERVRRCWMGDGCKDCKAHEAALAGTPLRELTAKQLQHYAYNTTGNGPEDHADYKHFVPRVFELMDEIALMGNPPVVVHALCRTAGERIELTQAERSALDGVLVQSFARFVARPSMATFDVQNMLGAYAKASREMGPFFAVVPEEIRQGLRDECNADEGAGYYGWPEEPFAGYVAWLGAATAA